MKISSLSITLLGLCLSSPMVLASQILPVNEHKRVEADISKDQMNRLTVLQDRIAHIFGEEGTFLTQHDEQNGQVFIRPTADNGERPLSLTLITENGLTQDLTLRPKAMEGTTLILKQATPHKALPIEVPGRTADHSPQAQAILTLKQAILGQLPLIKHKPTPRKTPVKLQFERAYQGGIGLVTVWSVPRDKTGRLFEEKACYQPFDIALSLQPTLNPKKHQAVLYVLHGN